MALELTVKAQVLEGRGTRGILKFRASEMAFLGVFKRYFPLWMPCCFVRVHARLGTMLSFHDIARFEHFTDLNLFKYVFSVIQIWEMDALQFY